MSYQSQKVTVEEKTMTVFEFNGGEKGTVVGIHGLTGNGLQLRYYGQLLADLGYRVITMDLRGRGESEIPEGQSSILSHVQDIKGLIEALEIKDPILMGYSMGGFIASIIASQIPDVSGLILLDGAATMTEHQRPIVEPSLGRLSKQWTSQEEYVDTVSAGYESFGVPRTSDIEEILKYELADHGAYWENKGDEEVIRHDWASFWDYDVKMYGPQIKVPTLLIICNGEIGANPPLFLKEHYENTVESIEGIEVFETDANHYNLVFTPRQDVNKVIKEFLIKEEI